MKNEQSNCSILDEILTNNPLISESFGKAVNHIDMNIWDKLDFISEVIILKEGLGRNESITNQSLINDIKQICDGLVLLHAKQILKERRIKND